MKAGEREKEQEVREQGSEEELRGAVGEEKIQNIVYEKVFTKRKRKCLFFSFLKIQNLTMQFSLALNP